jgi:hypothetical protein
MIVELEEAGDPLRFLFPGPHQKLPTAGAVV